MTYNVFSGTLNLTQSLLNQSCCVFESVLDRSVTLYTCSCYYCQEELSYVTKTEQLDLLQKVLAATDADAEEEQMVGVDWSTKKHKVSSSS